MAQLKAEGTFHIILLDDGSHMPENEKNLPPPLHHGAASFYLKCILSKIWKLTIGRRGQTYIYGYTLKNHGANASTDKSAIAKVQQLLVHVLNQHQIGKHNL